MITKIFIKSKENKIALDLFYVLFSLTIFLYLNVDSKHQEFGNYIFLIISIYGIVDLIIIIIKFLILKCDINKNKLIEINLQYVRKKKIVHRAGANEHFNPILYGYKLFLVKDDKLIKLTYYLSEPINISKDNINESFDMKIPKSIVCEYYKNSKVIKRLSKVCPNLNRQIPM